MQRQVAGLQLLAVGIEVEAVDGADLKETCGREAAFDRALEELVALERDFERPKGPAL